MLDVTPEDIAALGDADLRTLVGLLCEAELRKRGLPASAVTWGGHQDAADGGIDVRVRLPADTVIDGFIPRAETGFQVKKPDMPASEIKDEMRPKGALRPSIRDLADKAGAYIIACSSGSATDTALTDRVNAMEAAVRDLSSGSALALDFYDRTRLATWVRAHPGLIPWVRRKAGRQIAGWQSYGPWANPDEPADAEFVTDGAGRIYTGEDSDGSGFSAIAGIEKIRAALAEPGKVVRLVGLSGVGKTRLIQALFDSRLGSHSLNPALAIYTNTIDSPDPPPVGMVSDLVVAESRAIMVVDNCPADMHRRLAEVCKGSSVDVITVEYDIREDQPEGTEVFSLEPSSIEVTDKVLRRRFPQLSQVDSGRIAAISGGNFRMALALASTVERGESVSSLSDSELFERLFYQRHEKDPALFQAAEVCSLLYSFDGESTDPQDELARLGSMVGQQPIDLYRRVAELRRRDLVQARSHWRAVLPHAIANRLASLALENIPLSTIETQLVTGAPERVKRSFSRRLGYLDNDAQARHLVQNWLSPGGLLSEIATLDALHAEMLVNVAPVAPEEVLAAIEREAQGQNSALLVEKSGKVARLLRSLAYDQPLFERCARLLIFLAVQGTDEQEAESLKSLFFAYLSGTLATVEQRIEVMEDLVRSPEPKKQALGLQALSALLEAWHFSSAHDFEFGSHKRDFGYEPTPDELRMWFSKVIVSVEKFIAAGLPCDEEIKRKLASAFRGLWVRARMYDDLERLTHLITAKNTYWREGWIAARETLRYHKDELDPEARSRLEALENELRPKNLVDKVRSVVLSSTPGAADLEDYEEDEEDEPSSSWERTEKLAERLGAEVAADIAAFKTLLPEVLSGSGRLISFGQGLASATSGPKELMGALREGLATLPEPRRNLQVLIGTLRALGETHPEAVATFMDMAVTDPVLGPRFPALQSAINVGKQGVERLKRSLELGLASIDEYRHLAWGQAHDSIETADLRLLVVEIGCKGGGVWPAFEIVFYRLFGDSQAKRPSEPEIVDAGRSLLMKLPFTKITDRDDHHLGLVVRRCLCEAESASAAQIVCERFKKSAIEKEADLYRYNDFLQALCETQPLVVLDTLFTGGEEGLRATGRAMKWLSRHHKNPLDAIPDNTLIQWCDQDPAERYPAMASVVSFVRGSEEEDHTSEWSSIALKLMERAPDPADVLRRLTSRFRPPGWSGSLASILEGREMLLDELMGHSNPALAAVATEEASRLTTEIEETRRWEAKLNRREERFE